MDVNFKEMSSDALAYLGDCVIEMQVREYLVTHGVTTSGALNKNALEYVKAGAQAKAMLNILPILTPDECAMYKRGRNKQGGNVPKSASMSEYRSATGMEVLFGYLHLSGNHERIKELFKLGYSIQE